MKVKLLLIPNTEANHCAIGTHKIFDELSISHKLSTTPEIYTVFVLSRQFKVGGRN